MTAFAGRLIESTIRITRVPGTKTMSDEFWSDFIRTVRDVLDIGYAESGTTSEKHYIDVKRLDDGSVGVNITKVLPPIPSPKFVRHTEYPFVQYGQWAGPEGK